MNANSTIGSLLGLVSLQPILCLILSLRAKVNRVITFQSILNCKSVTDIRVISGGTGNEIQTTQSVPGNKTSGSQPHCKNRL